MIGHIPARAYLERTLPTATLLYGPRSVGKWTLATHLADHHRVSAVDRWQVDHGLTVDTVRLITHFAARAPHGTFKMVIARLDNANPRALNALLKTIEEPPPQVKFLFTSTGKPLGTVLSRCTVFELGALSTTDLERVYRDQGYSTVRAQQAARYARGVVERGYQMDSAQSHRQLVIALMKSVAVGDHDQFTHVLAHWDGRCSELLTTFFTECLTRRWVTFREAETAGLPDDRRRLWQMVAALMRVQAARPRLGVRAALEPFLTRR